MTDLPMMKKAASSIDEFMDLGGELANDMMGSTGKVLPMILAGSFHGHVLSKVPSKGEAKAAA